MKSLLKFVRLPARDRLLLLKAFILLGLVRLGLWQLPFKRLQQFLYKISHSPQALPVSSIGCGSIHKIVWAVDVSSHLMPGHVKCLARALTTQVLMSRRGYMPDLRIGVAKDQNNCLEAHAWIELEGSVVIGLLPDLKRFVPMPSLGIDLL
ncbi:hypothetical protein C1752_04997 [Acaryochloris thomasi RCC1774]|uniref:Microcin J25-processing protein McjB C-terminal domain-containing protein n=1 Tax=Acaryochloris thomasi RCC1774 TaxID=1764569 RepID=A0A2W1JCM1_9CYAN|nr:lasso peptide biosynthesis B2 protein [Acaryochloris thomasi]PZD71689.1 hypothetical protein C1752_04997 [Acaryochloris thomasi RCC1774]